MAQAARDQQEGLVVFIPGYAELPFDYYFNQTGLPVESQGYPQNEVLLHPDTAAPVPDVGALLAGRPRVWLVERDVAAGDPNGLVQGWLEDNGYVLTDQWVHEPVKVWTYMRGDLAEAAGVRPVGTARKEATP